MQANNYRTGFDGFIRTRVRAYVLQNGRKDIDKMARDLQMQFPEYLGVSLQLFRATVAEAFHAISPSLLAGHHLEEGLDGPIAQSPYTKVKRSSANEAIAITDSEDSDDAHANGNRNGSDSGAKTYRDVTITKMQNTPSVTPPAHGTAIPEMKRRSRSPLRSTVKKPKREKPTGKFNGTQSIMTQDIQFLKPRKPREKFQDIGGMHKALGELYYILLHVKSPTVYYTLGLMPPHGILLHGPPGSGKTLLARAIAGQLDLPLIEIVTDEFITGHFDESKRHICDVFEQAAQSSPCVLFLDKIDAVFSRKGDKQRRVLSLLISSLEELRLHERGDTVLIIGATKHLDLVDPTLRRIGRFDREVAIGMPNRKERKDILSVICDGVEVDKKLDIGKIAELTPGYVGADLLALVSHAVAIAANKSIGRQMRTFQRSAQQNITIVDLVDDAEGALDGTNRNQSHFEEEPKENNCPTEDGKSPEKAMEVDSDINEKTTTTEHPKPDEPAIDEKGTTTTDKSAEQLPKTLNDTTSVDAPEPLGFQLFNWMQNPPEGLGFDDDENGITIDDFREALKFVRPIAELEGFITVPDVTWDDVGSLLDIRKELKLAISVPVKYPERSAHLGIKAPSGILLCGPPGCGKTILAKAVANETGINFISVNMHDCECERMISTCFQWARNSAPCLVFFDELDSLFGNNYENGPGRRIVSQLLTEMSRFKEHSGVYVLAASNQPDKIDPAILRPGRFEKILYVQLPQQRDREQILKAVTKSAKHSVLAGDVNFDELAQQTDGYTGADLVGLVKEASVIALNESIINTECTLDNLYVRKQHFEEAIKKVRPSVSAKSRAEYEKLRLKYAAFGVPEMDADVN